METDRVNVVVLNLITVHGRHYLVYDEEIALLARGAVAGCLDAVV